MAEKMITLLKNLFLENWQRKLISVGLAIFIWMMVNQSLITSRTINNIPIRVINIPTGKTIVELQNNGILAQRTGLTLTGNKTVLDELTANDLEVVIDAQNKQGEWIASISKRNLTSTNPEIDISKRITRVSQSSVIIRLTKLVSEKIPIFITQPIGEAPKDYQFLDIWPYQLTLNVSGAEEVVKRLKSKGVRLTFDLSNISKAELDALRSRPDSPKGDEVSFYVPEEWKRVNLPLLSDTPIEINDPRAKDLRIDFVRMSLIPINSSIPLSLYFPSEALSTFNPKTVSFGTSPLMEIKNGSHLLSEPLYAKGVSHLFVKIVEQMIQVSITIQPTHENQYLSWSTEFINPRLLEDRYVSLVMSDVSDEDVRELQPLLREEYLRNRFRSYMNRFQIYKADDKKLDLRVQLQNGRVILSEGALPLPNSTMIRKEQ